MKKRKTDKDKIIEEVIAFIDKLEAKYGVVIIYNIDKINKDYDRRKSTRGRV